MSEPFPSKAYRELCVENADRLERLYEPTFGDLVLCWDADKAEWAKDLWCVIGRYSEDAIDVIRQADGAIGPVLIVDCVPLFQPRQLIRMLEERGWRILGLSKTYRGEGKEWWVVTQDESGDMVDGEGPDPATALLRAYLSLRDSEEEVVKEKK